MVNWICSPLEYWFDRLIMSPWHRVGYRLNLGPFVTNLTAILKPTVSEQVVKICEESIHFVNVPCKDLNQGYI